MIHRRAFFKTGVVGALILGTSFSLKRSLSFSPALPEFSFLDRHDVFNLKTLSRSILKGSPLESEEDLVQVVKGVEVAILGLSKPVQDEIKELLFLFKWNPSRILIGFDPRDQDSSDKLIQKWRHHPLQLFRGAYGALCELINASYYGNPSSWESIGYPGPPEID